MKGSWVKGGWVKGETAAAGQPATARASGSTPGAPARRSGGPPSPSSSRESTRSSTSSTGPSSPASALGQVGGHGEGVVQGAYPLGAVAARPAVAGEGRPG